MRNEQLTIDNEQGGLVEKLERIKALNEEKENVDHALIDLSKDRSDISSIYKNNFIPVHIQNKVRDVLSDYFLERRKELIEEAKKLIK